MSKNNPNEVKNFEQLMRKYIKDNKPIINEYDYQSPLRKIEPLEPLIFQNDIFPQSNNSKNLQKFEPIYGDNNNKDVNMNQRNNLIDNINNNINDNKFITPSKPINNKNISMINSSIEREKEAKEEKKKKQLEYQKMLDEQIKEKKIRKKLEKEKRLQEELKYEEKLKLENEEYQQELIKNKNKYRNINNNLFSGEEQVEKINPIISSNNLILEKNNINNNINIAKDMDENFQNDLNYHNNGIKRTKSQQNFEVNKNNNIFEINKNQKYQLNNPYIGGEGVEFPENPLFQNQDINQNPDIPAQQIPIEHLVSTSSQIPPQFLNPQQNHPQTQYKTQNNYYPSNRNFQNQSQNIFQNLNSQNIKYPPQSQPPQADLSPYLTQRQYYDYRQKLHRNPSELGSNTNISISPSNYPTSYQIPFNDNLMNSSPNPINYNNNSQNVNELLNMKINSQNNYFGKIMEIFFHEQEKIIESYKETIEKLKLERDEAIYKNKANEEKILALQKMQNDQEILEKNLGYYPFKKNYKQNMEKTLDSIIQKNEEINDNKKGDQSLNNINNNSNISDSKLASLITSTKFVKVNPNNDTQHLLVTWKKEDKENENETEEKNKNKVSIKNKFKLNRTDTNAFMEKINMINNKILEPQDEPLNYLNNNISIISKTQKNDDKSFANELSERNDKIEISNINNDKEEISNNIRDSDLSTRKFVAELQSKDFLLNNAHSPKIQNLDNNVSYSTQIKERMEEKNKNNMNKRENKKMDIISEKESRLSHNFDDEEKKEKYINYAFKQVKCSNSNSYKNINNDSNNNSITNKTNDIKNIKVLPGLKNIDNNVTVSNSKKNYSLLLSGHSNNNDNNDIKKNKDKEKNQFDNIISLNDEEENMNNINSNNDTKKRNIEDKNQEIEEDINDLPNLDSPKNNTNKIRQIIDIERNMDQNNNINDHNNRKNEIIIEKKDEDKKEKEIMDRLNFFEDDNNLSVKFKLNKKESKNNKFNNINIDINDSLLKEKEKEKESNSKNGSIKNNFNEISKHTNRPPSDLTGEKISSLNNLYDQFTKKKKEQLNETNNSVVNNNANNMANNSLLNESLNTFTQNLNKKWKDLSKKDINNIKINREQHYNNIDNTFDNNINNNFSYLDDDKFEDEKIFDKVNQFTRVALNELKQSQLSVFNKEKTIKKYE